MKHHLEDEVRRELHPEAPVPFSPRLPKGCDQQGRYPEVADVRIDPDEIDELGLKMPPPAPWWQDWLLVLVAALLLVAIFAPLGVK